MIARIQTADITRLKLRIAILEERAADIMANFKSAPPDLKPKLVAEMEAIPAAIDKILAEIMPQG